MFYQEYLNNKLEDGLLSDGERVRVENVSLEGGAAIERGMILSASIGGAFSEVADTIPATDILVIAAEDVTSDATITTAYTSGSFRTDKLKTGGNVEVASLKEHLRRENIILTEAK